ncbi:MAG: carboxypeptidase regulatory-like domain-containing protein [Acidobacteria bacterium]|nr:carboxypeptidase regulatory-like domain-containing protein [Acidobacteriota bacterium]MBV9925794.1 carboxypeptidase regulatory-like domain-containing protein [Acidobacteriota bacterium]
MKASFKAVGRGLGLLLALALCAGAALAQQAASLRGQVADEFGGVIIGATVTVTDASGKAKSVVTDSDGSFNVPGLQPGRYSVRIFSTGFAPFENPEVEIVAGRNELPKVTLGVSLEKEEVTVASEGPLSVDTASAGAIVLKGKDLEALPEDPDELAAALQALAGPAAGPNGGQITIDGFEGGRIPSRDSIREIRVNDNPLSAENDRPGFGGIQIFTKPGTDKLRGSLGMTFNDESLNSRNPFLQTEKRPAFQYRQYSGNLSGTIVPKKASFFLDFFRNETDDNDLVNGFQLDPANINGTPLRVNFATLTPLRNWSINPRVDYSINAKNTLVARYSFFHSDSLNQGVSQYALPERAFDTTSSNHTLQLTETAVLNKTTVNETRFQFIRTRFANDPLNVGVATVNVFDAFTSGAATVGNSFNETKRWEITNTTTQAHGAHSLKFGARVRGVHLSDFSENNFNGTYTFSSLDQYRRAVAGESVGGVRVGPTQFTLTTGEPLASISQVDFGGFVQDDWKLRPNLTLGGGVRYERQTNLDSNFNFAPRVYLAWSPDAVGGKQAKTVIRLGFGLFYDRIGESIALTDERLGGAGLQQQFVVRDPTILAQTVFDASGHVVSGGLTAAQLAGFATSQATRQLAPDATAPYSYISGFMMTRQLTKTTTLNVFFSTYDTRHLLRSRNINAPLDINGTFRRPQPALGDIYQYETSGTQSMKQLNIGVTKQFRPGFSLSANYTIGKAQSNADFGGFPMNQYDLSGEYGRTSFDSRQRLFLIGSAFIPKLKLSLNPLIIANTGRPFNIITGFDDNRDGLINDRPAFADSQTVACAPGQIPGLVQAGVTPCGLVQTRFGNFDLLPKPGQTIIPRNYAEGPGFFSVNLRVGRTFAFGDLPGAADRRKAAEEQKQQQQQRGNRGGGADRASNRDGGERGGGGAPRGGGGPIQGGMAGGPIMIMMGAPGGTEGKRYSLNFSLNFVNLFNRTNDGPPVGNLRSANFGESLFPAGSFGFGGGNPNAGNRRVQASVRFSF